RGDVTVVGVWLHGFKTDRGPGTSCSQPLAEASPQGPVLAKKKPTKDRQNREILHLTAEARADMNLCYILDGILILYGIILTVLYCRLKMSPASPKPEKKPAEGGIYAGLSSHTTDEYDVIRTDKRHVV
ncbi:Fc receptor, IgE, high affinity I, gamma polypeptide like, partial [Menidia menidia]